MSFNSFKKTLPFAPGARVEATMHDRHHDEQKKNGRLHLHGSWQVFVQLNGVEDRIHPSAWGVRSSLH